MNKAVIERIIPEVVRDTAAYLWLVNYAKSYVNFNEDAKKAGDKKV